MIVAPRKSASKGTGRFSFVISTFPPSFGIPTVSPSIVLLLSVVIPPPFVVSTFPPSIVIPSSFVISTFPPSIVILPSFVISTFSPSVVVPPSFAIQVFPPSIVTPSLSEIPTFRLLVIPIWAPRNLKVKMVVHGSIVRNGMIGMKTCC
jgi:hypothetical protein